MDKLKKLGVDDNIISALEAKKEVLSVLKSSGKSRNSSDFPLLEVYIQDTDNRPFVKSYDPLRFNQKFLESIEKMGAQKIFSRSSVREKSGKINHEEDHVIFRLTRGYFLEVDTKFVDSNGWEYDDNRSNEDNYLKTFMFSLYTPGESSSLYSKQLEDTVHDLAERNMMKVSVDSVSVGMVCKENTFYIKDFYITRDYTLNNPNLHYGHNFDEFHRALVDRFKSEPKGLVLFHGEPGTGKTYYIRNLIKELVKIGKKVIYFPPNMISHLTSPDVMTFLSSVVMDYAEDGKSCVLLLEDAEPLLVSRSGGGRSDGITNLLNLTDGLLNDMLSMQVIATFNIDLKDIDQALLRPERLIARKEFKKLKAEDANILAKTISLDKEFENDTSLAEIYSQQKSKEILIHEYENGNSRKIGFK